MVCLKSKKQEEKKGIRHVMKKGIILFDFNMASNKIYTRVFRNGELQKKKYEKVKKQEKKTPT